MASASRQVYLNNVFNRMHEKLNDAYEHVHDGDFEESKNTVNSLIYDLRQLKKSMDP